jgi:hypothetical protein
VENLYGETWFATLFGFEWLGGMTVASCDRSRRCAPTELILESVIMAPTSSLMRGAPGSPLPTSDPKALLDFRLRFANRIVEESWRERKSVWARDDIGLLLLDMLEDDLSFDWSAADAVEHFKEYLALAYIAAGDVLPASQRTF